MNSTKEPINPCVYWIFDSFSKPYLIGIPKTQIVLDKGYTLYSDK
jgi:hypothetical protein